MRRWTLDETVFLLNCQNSLISFCLCVWGCPSQRHSDVADPNDWDIIGRAREGGLCRILMKLGTKPPPGLINLPKTCLCFSTAMLQTLPTSCPKGFRKSHLGHRRDGLQEAQERQRNRDQPSVWWGIENGGGRKEVVFVQVEEVVSLLNATFCHRKRKT